MMNAVMNPIHNPVHGSPTSLNSHPHSARKSILSEHMLHDLGHLLNRQYGVQAAAMKSAVAAEMGLRLNDYKALEYIMEFDALPIGQLAQLLDLSASGVTSLVKRLIKKGFVRKGQHPLDKRVTALYPIESECTPILHRKEQALEYSLREAAEHNPSQLLAVYDFLLNNTNSMRRSTQRWLDHNDLVSRSL